MYVSGSDMDRCSSEHEKPDTELPYRTYPPQNRLPYLLERRKENKYTVARRGMIVTATYFTKKSTACFSDQNKVTDRDPLLVG